MAAELTLTVRAVRRRYLFLSGLRWFATGLTFPVQMLLYAARGLDLSAVGLLLALFSGLVVLLELPTGGLADLLGRRRTMLVSAGTYVCSALCVAVAHAWWQFAIAVSLSAAARALGSGPLDAWYVDTVRAIEPGTSLRAGISWGWAIEALALGVAATVGGSLPGWSDGLRGGPFVPLSVPALCAATVGLASLTAHAILMVEPPRGEPSRPRGRAVLGVPAQIRDGARLALADPVIRTLVARTAAIGVAIVTLEMLAPLQFAALLGGPERAAAAYGLLVTAAWLGSGAGSALAPALCRLGRGDGLRTGAAATALTGAAVGLLGLAAAGLGGFLLAAAGYVLAYVLAGVPGPLAMEVLHDRVDAARRATLVSVDSLALQLGVLGGSLTVPRLAGHAGFGYGWLAATAALLLAAFLTLAARRARPRRREPAVPLVAVRNEYWTG